MARWNRQIGLKVECASAADRRYSPPPVGPGRERSCSDRSRLSGYCQRAGNNAATARQKSPTRMRMTPGRAKAPVIAAMSKRLMIASSIVRGSGSAINPSPATQMPTICRICFGVITGEKLTRHVPSLPTKRRLRREA